MSVSRERLMKAYRTAADSLGRCSYPSSDDSNFTSNKIVGREGVRTHFTAFREILDQKVDIESLTVFLRSGYVEDVLNLEQMREFSAALSSLPVYMSLRRDSPVKKGALPPSAIDLARSAAGIFMPVASMCREFVPKDIFLSVDDIYNYANGNNPERTNYFVNLAKNPESCPAPEPVVKQAIDFMLNKTTSVPDICANPDWACSLKHDEIPNIIAFGLPYWILRVGKRPPETDQSPKATEIRVLLDECLEEANIALGLK